MEEEEEDRISQLPQHILQNHILSLLSQDDAVRTCVLSKSWRHLGPTRPKIEFRESLFGGSGSNQKFLSGVENTLQRYHEQNLSIHEFILGMLGSNSKSISLLNKWIPIVLMNMGVKTFNLTAHNFSLPSVLFQAESLTELYLIFCKLDQINNNVKLPALKRLSLHSVYIEDETFEKIMSSCPLIQHLVLDLCQGLSIVKVNKARYLKHFDCHMFRESGKNDSIEIEDAPSLETIRIRNCRNWYHLLNNYFSPRLKSLFLWNVHLPTESLNNLSSNFPCLEELEIRHCSGFNESTLSNCSIKRLKAFRLSAHNSPLPSVVFQAEFLEELHLDGCKLDQINNNCTNVKLQMLKRLSLKYVWIEDETFEKIMSSCPLIQHLVLDSCKGLGPVKVNKARNLKHFDCCSIISIEINDAPSLETIHIRNCQNWHHHNNCFFPRLKSLKLWYVHLQTESLNNLSSNHLFPCLEELEIRHCSGFTELELSNRSIKRVIINVSDRPIKAAINIDAANILYFELVSSSCLPSMISFATTSREWKSRVEVWGPSDSNATWLHELHEILKALSQSQISLDISYFPLTISQDTYGGGNSCEPVVIEHLCLTAHCSSSASQALLNSLLRICRPRNKKLPLYADSQKRCESQQNLEKSNIRVSDKNRNERLPVVRVSAMSSNLEIAAGFLPFIFLILLCWIILTYVWAESII